MPDRIASRVDDPYRSWEPNDDDDDSVCREPSLSKVSKANPNEVGGAAPSSEDAHLATPASEPGVQSFQADAHAHGGDLYAGAFALKGHDPRGTAIEVFSASAHGGSRELLGQVAMARVGVSMFADHLVVRGEAFTAQARAGNENADGSKGLSSSLGSTVVGGEITGNYGGYSVTLGASVGTTFGYSLGVRDNDHDGKDEYCGRVDFGTGTIGACIEKLW